MNHRAGTRFWAIREAVADCRARAGSVAAADLLAPNSPLDEVLVTLFAKAGSDWFTLWGASRRVGYFIAWSI